MNTKQSEYNLLCQLASACRDCPSVYHKLTYLNKNNGNVNSPLMFIGEAPGFVKDPTQRLKAFHGNTSGSNFEFLLDSIGLTRDSVFVTNALLHTPVSPSKKKYDDDYGYLQIRPPSRDELQNCGKFLQQQIDIVNPKIVCTLGRAALDSCHKTLYQFPELQLYRYVAKVIPWNGRIIFPLYHTSPNVTSSIRSLKQMEEDFNVLKHLLHRLELVCVHGVLIHVECRICKLLQNQT